MLMKLGGMMLPVVISAVGFSSSPEDVKLALSGTVTDPIVVPHVHGFGPVLLDAIVGDAADGAIVRDHWGGRLGTAELI
jgi:hypothetical protein